MTSLVLSCETATCAVPEQHRATFAPFTDRLSSSEGWEPGSLNLAQGFAMKFRTPLIDAHVSRLLVDVSRSENDPARWSDISAKLTEAQRDQLHERRFLTHLGALRTRIQDALKREGRALHLSIRTHPVPDTPDVHHPDLGLGFDPLRIAERDLADRWLEMLRTQAPDLRISANEPEEGASHGLLQQLRDEFPDPSYLALTVTASQSFFLKGEPWRWDKAKRLLLDSFAALLDEFPGS